MAEKSKPGGDDDENLLSDSYIPERPPVSSKGFVGGTSRGLQSDSDGAPDREMAYAEDEIRGLPATRIPAIGGFFAKKARPMLGKRGEQRPMRRRKGQAT